MSLRDGIELLALALVVAAIALATALLWPPLVAAGLALFYVSHTWDLERDDPADEMRAALNQMVMAARTSRVSRETVLDTVERIVNGPEDEDVTADGTT